MMDLCSSTTFGSKSETLVYYRPLYFPKIHNFSFKSLQTSLMTRSVSFLLYGSFTSMNLDKSIKSSLSLPGREVTEQNNNSSNPEIIMEDIQDLSLESDKSSEETLGETNMALKLSDDRSVTQKEVHLSPLHDHEDITLFYDCSSEPVAENDKSFLSFSDDNSKVSSSSEISGSALSTGMNSVSLNNESNLDFQLKKTLPTSMESCKLTNPTSNPKEPAQVHSSLEDNERMEEAETGFKATTKATQNLFTPEDLFKEDMQPNPYKTKSEIYQNLNAKESAFVLQHPNRKPREDPLTDPTLQTSTNASDLSTADGGLIEPLATEDDVALIEGNKEFVENGICESIGSPLISPEYRPYEAVNFSLEQEIDNFDRDEYVKFRKDSNQELEIPNASETWLLQLLLTRPKGNRMLNKAEKGCSRSYNRRGYRGNPDVFFYNPKSVPKYFSETRYAIKHRSRTNVSRKCSASCRGAMEKPGCCDKKDPAPGNALDKSTNTTAGMNGNDFRNKSLISSASFESASTTNIFDLTKSRHSKDAFTPFYRSFDESFISYEETEPLLSNENSESHEAKSNITPKLSEKHKHKKTSKHCRNAKYQKKSKTVEKSCLDGCVKDSQNTFPATAPKSLRFRKRPDYSVISASHVKEPNPLTTYGEKVTPKTTLGILEEVQSNLRARLASLEELNVLADDTTERVEDRSEKRSLFSYKLLEDSPSSFKANSVTPPSSSSSPSLKDDSSCAGATRKKKGKKKKKMKKKDLSRFKRSLGRRRKEEEDDSDTEALCRRQPPVWPSSSPSSLSGDSRLSFPSSRPSERSSSSYSSSSSSSSSSESTSSSTIDSSEAEDSLIDSDLN